MRRMAQFMAKPIHAGESRQFILLLKIFVEQASKAGTLEVFPPSWGNEPTAAGDGGSVKYVGKTVHPFFGQTGGLHGF